MIADAGSADGTHEGHARKGEGRGGRHHGDDVGIVFKIVRQHRHDDLGLVAVAGGEEGTDRDGR